MGSGGQAINLRHDESHVLYFLFSFFIIAVHMLAIFLLSHLEHFPDIRNIRIRMEDILEFDGQ